MANDRVYVLVAVDKDAVLDSLAASTTVKACLRDVWFEDTFAVADVTKAVYLHSGSSVYINGQRVWALDE